MIKKHIIYCIFIVCLCCSISCAAQEKIQSDNNVNDLDIMFVIDCSNSMNAKDRKNLASNIVETFVDNMYSKKMRVGFVTYNQEILNYTRPVDIRKEKNREAIKVELSNIKSFGGTDTGVALKKAANLVGKEGCRKSAIILITDGKPDMSYSKKERTLEACYKDIDETAVNCKSRNVPIYTIVLDQSSSNKNSFFHTITKDTKGKVYFISDNQTATDVFNSIIQENIICSSIPVVTSASSGDLESIEISLENDYVQEANLLVVASGSIKEADVFYCDKKIDFIQKESYLTSKINEPHGGKIRIKYHIDKGDSIKAYLLLYQDVNLKIAMPKEISKGKDFTVGGYFVDYGTQRKVKDEKFYNQFDLTLTLLQGLELVQTVPLLYENNKFSTNIRLNKSGDYQVVCTLKSKNNLLNEDKINLRCINDRPKGALVLNNKRSLIDNEQIYNLDEFFYDPNGDELTYSLAQIKGQAAKCEIIKNKLKITPKKLGKVEFSIIATDSENEESISDISCITVLPLWGWRLGITASIVIIILSYYYIRNRINKPYLSYYGKLNIYFKHAPEALKKECFTYSLFQREPRSISLADLLQETGYNIKNAEFEKIFFEPSHDKKIIFCHDSQNAIMVNTSIACRKLKYPIAYGTIIYMTSSDEAYDLELHFVSEASDYRQGV